MNIGEKYSSLFHHVLQSERNVNIQTAREALVLINWMFEKYRTYCCTDGYEIEKDIIFEFNTLITALEIKTKQNQKRHIIWPRDIFNKWELEKPFHEAVIKYLKSDWGLFWSANCLIKKIRYRRNPKQIDLLIMAEHMPIHQAWDKVLRTLLDDKRWNISTFPTIPDQQHYILSSERICVVFGSIWNEENRRAAQDMLIEKIDGEVQVISYQGVLESLIHNISFNL